MREVQIRCAGKDCHAQTALGFPDQGPVPAAFFRTDGWVAVPDRDQRLLLFLCASCFEAMIAGRPDGAGEAAPAASSKPE